MTRSPGDRAVLLETIETQRFGCEMSGSDLYAEILRHVADGVASGNVMSELLAPVATAPFGDAVILRLLGALHLLVLDGRAPELARHYPSAGGEPGRSLGIDLERTAEAHRDEIAVLLTQGVQTNEVGRSAALLGGYLEVARLGLPLHVLEVGASAGLNLLFDRYRYVGPDGRTFGPPESPLVFEQPWFAEVPDLTVPLVVQDRRGCDVAPIDVTTADGRQRLRSFVWGDQLDRLARLDAALAVAQADPPVVDRTPAPEWLRDRLDAPRPGCTTVVAHSIMFQYLSDQGRREMLEAIDAAGRAATPDAPFAWLRLEPGGDQAELRLTTWPDGTTHLLAKSSYHGPPVVWRAPAGGVLRPLA
ncbi:DUF2332 domain-containing protein [Aquihabitans daechungensis]|uniref:DUF2332 domain-containing protein n=1 Tax=Aquihabitans daechungensis TaxID=1052257 RepID=UPI003BA22F00